MPKVSQNPLSPETKREIAAALTRTLARINDEALLERFLDNLLTPTERVMLGKRLMVAVLLQKGYSYGAVCRVLKMSKTTVHLIQRELLKTGEGYQRIYQLFFRASRSRRILKKIEAILDALTLPMKGSSSDMRRWKRALRRV